MDLIGDLGGVHDLIVFFLSLFLSPVSEFSFISKILSKMYLVRTTSQFFKHPTQMLKKNKKTKYKNTKVEIPDSLNNPDTVKMVNSHYPITFSFKTKLKLFILPKCL